MKTPFSPVTEKERIAAINEYDILDTLPEKDFDEITRIASEICQTPIALVTLLDKTRQWFKSHHGLAATETSIEYSFCRYAVLKPDEIMIVPNSLQDSRFKHNPFVTGDPNVIFYAGVPLTNPEGIPLGTLCVIDNQPRNLNENQVNSLKALANQVICQLELRKKIRLLKESELEIKKANAAVLEEKRLRIEQSSFITSHELRHEFTKILSVVHLNKINRHSPENDQTYIDHIEHIANSMNAIIEKLNATLNPDTGIINDSTGSAFGLSEAEEICLIDDDPFINLLNSKIIQTVFPGISLKIFERADSSLMYIKKYPNLKRFIFLDLNMPVKSGWDFLDDFLLLKAGSPVVILSSTIDPDDHKKAKNYKDVLAIYSKPLTTTIIENLS